MNKHEKIWSNMSFWEKSNYIKQKKEIAAIDEIRKEYPQSTYAERRKIPSLSKFGLGGHR